MLLPVARVQHNHFGGFPYKWWTYQRYKVVALNTPEMMHIDFVAKTLPRVYLSTSDKDVSYIMLLGPA